MHGLYDWTGGNGAGYVYERFAGLLLLGFCWEGGTGGCKIADELDVELIFLSTNVIYRCGKASMVSCTVSLAEIYHNNHIKGIGIAEHDKTSST